MTKLKIELTESAVADIDHYIDFITQNYSAPLTALRHYQGLFDAIYGLKTIAKSTPLSTNHFIINLFGIGTKRINYKRMAILYKIKETTIIVIAVIPQANIKI
jgi:hypothetical protein